MSDLSPREIVSELDRYIVGQGDAKRAVAIALRNRWRRLRLTSPMREEVMPKNILMIGPTGCGKTEIARRLEAMLLVADKGTGFVLTGSGDVLEPEGDSHGSATAIGSGGNYALAAARALLPTEFDPEEIVRRSMAIAASICVYTNTNLVLESLTT